MNNGYDSSTSTYNGENSLTDMTMGQSDEGSSSSEAPSSQVYQFDN